MKPRPLKRHPSPSYPTRGELLEDIDLLRTHLPRRWQLGKDVAGAAAILLAANLADCGNIALGAAPSPPPSTVQAAVEPSDAVKPPAAKGRTVVAPIFEHGEGRGSTGCIVMTPPNFLSEEEAMQIIREELGKRGVRLRAKVPLKDIKIAPRRELPESSEGSGAPDARVRPSVTKPLVIDGLDPQKGIAVEFVSKDGYTDLDHTGLHGTASAYDFKGTAEYLAQEISQQGKEDLHVGVFYDPATYGGALAGIFDLFMGGTTTGRTTTGTTTGRTTRSATSGRASTPRDDDVPSADRTPSAPDTPQAAPEEAYEPEALSPAQDGPQSETEGASENAPSPTQEAQQLLRQQVQDFIAWLEKQKAL